MRFRSQINTLIILLIPIIAITFVAHTIAFASESENKQKKAITNKIVQYLKNKKVRSSDEKLKKIATSVYEEAKEYEIDYRLVLAVMKVESNFKSNAISKKGARGLLQDKALSCKACIERNRRLNKKPEMPGRAGKEYQDGCGPPFVAYGQI